MLQDLRYAFRTLLKSPGFTIVAVLTLALGIGANTAIFQLIDAVALRPLPIPHPEELVEVRIAGGNRGFGITTGRYAELTRPVWQQLKQDQQALSGLFAWRPTDVRVGERSNLRRAEAIEVSGDFFATLGVAPYLGRLLLPSDETSSCPASVAVVSHDYWQNFMGGRPLAPGTMLRVNMDPVEVVGVAPPRFSGLAVGDTFDVALPLCRPKELRREVFDIAVLGRLRPGWTIERASSHFDALSAGIFEGTAPDGYGADSIQRFKAFRLAAYSAARGVSALRTEYETALRLLFAFTAVILLIACANLANLLLARAMSRDRETAVRVAIGASRAALMRPLLAESCLIAAAGALMAVGLSQVLGRVLLLAITTGERGPSVVLATDWRILVFATLTAFVTCVLFGTAPAIRAARVDPIAAMRSGGRGTTLGHERLVIQRAMVAAQLAMALVMVVGAVLFVQTFRNLMTVDTGMRHAGVSVAFVRFPESVTKERFDDFRRELLSAIASLPGIVSAGSTSNVPLIGGSWTHGITVGAVKNSAQFTWVSPGYFDTMGIRILRGRDFTLRDTRASPRVAVVNQAFANRFTDGANPIGRTLRTGQEPGYPSTEYEIVGVIPDTHYNSLRGEQRAMIFAPDTQHPSPGPGAAIMIHSSVAPEVAVENVRRRIAERYPTAFAEFTILEARLRDSLVRERVLAMLAGFFGVLAVALTVVGLYGMLSYAVAQRRQEIGVRLALGARRAHVLTMVMREAGTLLAAGVIVGGVASVIAGRTITSLLFGVTPGDPRILLGACFLLCAIAAVASYLPARRATRVDPIVALRYE